MTEVRYLLDSNICIYFLAGQPLKLQSQMVLAEPYLAVSSISYAEVMLGAVRAGGAELAIATRFFGSLPVLPFNEHAAKAYARLPFRRGRFDRLIAAHALALGATLVTNDAADFADVPGLKLENWAA